jgi:uncharacterized protein YjbI with pentapeptide repeats
MCVRNKTNYTDNCHIRDAIDINEYDFSPTQTENEVSSEKFEGIRASDLVWDIERSPSPNMTEDVELPEAPSWLIENIEEASKNARSIYLLYLGFLAYCTLTVVSTSDRQLILNEGVSLPVIGVEIPFNIFIVAAPFLVMFIFCYLQLYLQNLKSLRVDLHENYASIDRKRLYPWMINIAENPKEGVIGKLQRLAVQISIWWLPPVVLILVTYWFLKKHIPFWSYVMGLVPGIGVGIVIYFWSQYDDHGHWMWGKKDRILMISFVFLFELYINLFAIPRSLDGKKTLGAGFFLDLSHEVLITEKNSEYDVPWLELRGVHLEGAHLRGAVLRNADLRFSHLERAYLAQAQMQSVYLGDADLKNADLTGAQLNNACLQGAKLKNADLRDTNLKNADLRNTRLSGATFSETNLQNTDLRGTRLKAVNFSDPNMEGADLRKANLRNVGFRGDNLKGADLRGAKLDSASFRSANLKNADLRNTRLVSVKLWETNLKNAKLPARLDSIDFTQATLDSSNFQGRNFQNANLAQVRLRNANLSQARLQGANLWGARLDGANLAGAQLQDVSFQTPRTYASIENRPLPNTSRKVLCRARTLYKAELDSTVSERLKNSCPRVLFTQPDFIAKNVAQRKLEDGASIFRARLDSVNLVNADLRDVVLQEADLQHANLYEANLSAADLRGANLQNAKLNSAYLKNVDLRGSRLDNANIGEVNLKNADLRKARFNGAALIDANLQNADLNHAQLDSADLAHANLKNANLQNVRIDTANFFKANLQGANLRRAQLGRAQFQETILKHARLPTRLDSAIFTKAVLDSVNLQGKNLQGAKLTQARLRDANLSQTQLQGANLWGARLDGANLLRADLRGVSFEIPGVYANLTRPVPTQSEDILCSAQTLYKAEMDPLISEKLRESCPQVIASPESTSTQRK